MSNPSMMTCLLCGNRIHQFAYPNSVPHWYHTKTRDLVCPVGGGIATPMITERLPERPELPLKYLRPEQYAKWLQVINDPDWIEFRHRAKKDSDMMLAIREVFYLRELLTLVKNKD